MERSRHAMSILTIAVMLSAWLAISNHCALGATVLEKAKPSADSSECPFHAKQASGKQKPQSSDSPCCKVLRAVAVSATKNVVREVVDLAGVDFSFPGFVVSAPPAVAFQPVTLDTGPPGPAAIAQFIRSMRAHAPPVLA